MRTMSPRWWISAAMLALWVCSGIAQANRGSNYPGATSTRGPMDRRLDESGTPTDPGLINTPSMDVYNASPESMELQARRERLRKEERKRHLVSDAKKLVELTQQFQTTTAGRTELTAADERRLDDIAKLARSVKERMSE